MLSSFVVFLLSCLSSSETEQAKTLQNTTNNRKFTTPAYNEFVKNQILDTVEEKAEKEKAKKEKKENEKEEKEKENNEKEEKGEKGEKGEEKKEETGGEKKEER